MSLLGSWPGLARRNRVTYYTYIGDISLLYLRLSAAPCREFECLTSLWELQKEPEKKKRNTNTLKIDVRHRYDAKFKVSGK